MKKDVNVAVNVQMSASAMSFSVQKRVKYRLSLILMNAGTAMHVWMHVLQGALYA